MKSLEEIKEKLKGLKPYLKERYKVKEIGIFGSYVRGEQRKKAIWIYLLDLMKVLR